MFRLSTKLQQLTHQYVHSEQQYETKVNSACISDVDLLGRRNYLLDRILQHVWIVFVLDEQLKQKSLELQIADLKIKQHEEKLIQEQAQMKLYAEQVSQLLSTENNLRLQLTADGEKFQQFQVNFCLCVYLNLWILFTWIWQVVAS